MSVTRAAAQPKARTRVTWPKDVHTLAIDVGGSGLKAGVLDVAGQLVTERTRTETPYPCPPPLLVSTLTDLARSFEATHQRVSVGFPGLVREGRVYNTPAFSRRTYGGEPDSELVDQWHGFDLADALSAAFGLPTKVANDADVQGCAVVEGTGFEFVMTLGTGVGTALFSGGVLLPHCELGHAPFRKGQSFEDQLGNAARQEVGNERWVRRVHKAVAAYDEFLFYDRMYIGGGNARLVKGDLPPNVSVVSNTAGITGGMKLWQMDLHNR
jgi:polyphosphate glucokinase